MTTEEKANRVRKAGHKLSAELLSECEPKQAVVIQDLMKLPDASLAIFHDALEAAFLNR